MSTSPKRDRFLGRPLGLPDLPFGTAAPEAASCCRSRSRPSAYRQTQVCSVEFSPAPCYSGAKSPLILRCYACCSFADARKAQPFEGLAFRSLKGFPRGQITAAKLVISPLLSQRRMCSQLHDTTILEGEGRLLGGRGASRGADGEVGRRCSGARSAARCDRRWPHARRARCARSAARRRAWSGSGSRSPTLVVGQPAAIALCDRPHSLTQIIPERVHSYRFIFQSP